MFNRIASLLALLSVSVLACFALSTPAQAAPPRVWDLPPRAISGTDQPAIHPSFSTGPDGTVYAVWSRRIGSSYQVEFSRRLPSARDFTIPVVVSTGDRDCYSPRVTAIGDGTAIVVWYVGGAVMAARSSTDGSFGTPLRLSPGNRTASNPAISPVSDDEEAVVIAWEETGGAEPRIGASLWRPDLGFTSAFLLSKAGQPAHGVRVAYDSSESQHVAMWIAEVGGYKRVQTSFRITSGAFQTPVNRSPADMNAADARIAGVAGPPLLVWRAQGPAGWEVQALDLGDGTGVTTLSTIGAAAFEPDVSSSPSGSFAITWSERIGANTRIQVTEKEARGPYGEPVAVSPAGVDAREPQVLASEDGSAFLVWLERTALGHRVMGSIREPGAAFAEPVGLSDPAIPAFSPSLSSTGDGQVLAGWLRRSVVEVAATVPFEPKPEPVPPGDRDRENSPAGGVATFDGKTLHFRLKCPARFRPACKGKASAMTGKGRQAKAMTGKVKANQKAGARKPVKLVVKSRFRKRIAKFAASPGKKTLVVRQVIRRKGKAGREQVVFHKYRVRGSS